MLRFHRGADQQMVSSLLSLHPETFGRLLPRRHTLRLDFEALWELIKVVGYEARKRARRARLP